MKNEIDNEASDFIKTEVLRIERNSFIFRILTIVRKMAMAFSAVIETVISRFLLNVVLPKIMLIRSIRYNGPFCQELYVDKAIKRKYIILHKQKVFT